MQMGRSECRDFGDPVSITRLSPLTLNTPASFLCLPLSLPLSFCSCRLRVKVLP